MTLFNKASHPGWMVGAAMILLMLLLQFIGPQSFRYQHDWLQTQQYWRLISAHWVHANWTHLTLNAAGLILCLSIASPNWTIRRWLTNQFVLALGISLLFALANPELGWYVGYSGVLYGVYLLAAIDLYPRDRLIAVLLAAAIVIKITLEQTTDINLGSSDIIGTPVIVDAHLYGVLLATAIALANRLIKIAGK